MKLFQQSKTYKQESDSLSNETQFLRVKIDDAGGGPYLILSTQRWSIDFDELDALVKKLKSIIKEFKREAS
jgi:hypothetical protein